MKIDNLNAEQLNTIKRLTAHALDNAANMCWHWHEKKHTVESQQAFDHANMSLQHWKQIEEKWYTLEDSINARICLIKNDDAS